MIRVARELGLDAHVVDGHELAFEREFDAVFSNAALHWMKRDPDAVVAGVARALKPGGRFVGEFGGHGNVAAIVTALLAVLARRDLDGMRGHPWYFPTPAAYRKRLEAHGFRVESIDLIPRPTPAADRHVGLARHLREPMLKLLPEGERAAVKEEAVELLAPALRDEAGNWTADYVRLRFRAVLAALSFAPTARSPV